MKRSKAFAILVVVIIAGCAVRMGGPAPVQRDTIAWRVPASITAEQLGTRLQQGGYEFALLATSHDSTFLASAATRAGLQMTRPGRIAGSNYVFFGPKAVGDTTHTVTVRTGGRVQLHDALFRIDKNRSVDLIIARFDSVTNISEGVRSLVEYVAKDVSGNAALLLGFEPPTPQIGDSVSLLLRALLNDTRDCTSGAPGRPSPIRLFYGPEVRVRCERAQVLNESGGPVSVQFVLQ